MLDPGACLPFVHLLSQIAMSRPPGFFGESSGVSARAGKRHRSITLIADGRHLLTDVVTAAGVLLGIALVAIFDWPTLDPLVALAVGVNVLWTGYGLLRRSVSGMLDAALPDEDQTLLVDDLSEGTEKAPGDVAVTSTVPRSES